MSKEIEKSLNKPSVISFFIFVNFVSLLRSFFINSRSKFLPPCLLVFLGFQKIVLLTAVLQQRLVPIKCEIMLIKIVQQSIFNRNHFIFFATPCCLILLVLASSPTLSDFATMFQNPYSKPKKFHCTVTQNCLDLRTG